MLASGDQRTATAPTGWAAFQLPPAMLAFVIRSAGAGLAFLLTVLFARTLGESQFGYFASCWMVVTIVGHAGPVGFGESVVRLLPRFLARGRLADARGLLILGTAVTLGATLGVSTTLAAALLLGGASLGPGTAALLLALACIPVFALQDWLEGVGRALGRNAVALAPNYVVRPLVTGVALLAALLAGAPATASSAIAACLAGLCLAGAFQAIGILRSLPAAVIRGRARFRHRNWFAASLPLAAALALDQIGAQADLLALSLLAPPEQVAAYFAAAKTVALAALAPYAIGIVAGCGFALRLALHDRPGLVAEARAATRWTFWATAALCLPLLVAGPWLLAMFGASYRSGALVLIILAAGQMARAMAGQAEDLLLTMGWLRLQVLVSAVAAMVALVGCLLAAPRFGAEGVAAAMAAAVALRAVLFALAVRATAGLSTFVGRDSLRLPTLADLR